MMKLSYFEEISDKGVRCMQSKAHEKLCKRVDEKIYRVTIKARIEGRGSRLKFFRSV